MGLREVEQLLDRTAANVLHLRASYFMENYCFSLRTIRTDGAVYLPVDGDVEATMIAAHDIGVEAARRIAARDWTGHTIAELVGPESLTFTAAAASLSEVLGQDIRHLAVSPERFRFGLIRMGWSRRSADLVSETYRALAEGKLVPEGTPQVATTTLHEFARQKLLEETTAHA
jgi:uncharacterized protein YbjT (DUF2867 family)